jgi:CrcB protein
MSPTDKPRRSTLRIRNRAKQDAFVIRRRARAAALPPLGRIVAVALGGALGTAVRYLLGNTFPTHPGVFPWTTFTVNISGAFLLGVAFTIFVERFPRIRHRQSFVCTGILGAYTTFSTFSVESVSLAPGVAAGYAITSLLAGLGAVLLGASFARLRSVPPPSVDPDLG